MLLELWRGSVLAQCWPVLVLPPGDEAAVLCSSLLIMLGKALADHSRPSAQQQVLSLLVDLGEHLALEHDAACAAATSMLCASSGVETPQAASSSSIVSDVTSTPPSSAATVAKPSTVVWDTAVAAEDHQQLEHEPSVMHLMPKTHQQLHRDQQSLDLSSPQQIQQQPRQQAGSVMLLSVLRECLLGFPQPQAENAYRHALEQQLGSFAFCWSLVVTLLLTSYVLRHSIVGRFDAAHLPVFVLWMLPYAVFVGTVVYKQWLRKASASSSVCTMRKTLTPGSTPGVEEGHEDQQPCSSACGSSWPSAEPQHLGSQHETMGGTSGTRTGWLSPTLLEVHLVCFDLGRAIALVAMAMGWLAVPGLVGTWFNNKLEIMGDVLMYCMMEQVRRSASWCIWTLDGESAIYDVIHDC